MKLDFSPSKSLFDLPIVKRSAAIFLGLAAATFVVIVLNLKGYSWDFSGRGFNTFATLCKVPAAILAVGFTIVGLCAANHRSEQSREQMRLTAEQNIFANHYKHIEEFEKYCKARHENVENAFEEEKALHEKHKSSLVEMLSLSGHLKPTHYRKVYRQIFPCSKVGDFSLSEKYVNSINEFIDGVYDIFNLLAQPTPSVWPRAVISLYDFVHGYASVNAINLSSVSTEKFEFEGETRHIPIGDACLILAEARDAVHIQIHALNFDVTYAPSEKITQFLNLDLEPIPRIGPPEFSDLPLQFTIPSGVQSSA
ncbi:MAG: hypothetical protein C0490_24335 [Marivirga sp.]|nr:hypothetical protein [Marivirga sp.]